MNRVRRVSRKYAELYNRPDHIARSQAKVNRAKFIQRRAEAKGIIANMPVPTQPDDQPPVSKAQAQMSGGRIRNFFRRGNR